MQALSQPHLLQRRGQRLSTAYMGCRMAYPEGILDAEELLSHHTQHLNVNAVKLVKAGPGARLSQASKELAHEAVVQPLATIEHDAIHAQCLTQVLQT